MTPSLMRFLAAILIFSASLLFAKNPHAEEIALYLMEYSHSDYSWYVRTKNAYRRFAPENLEVSEVQSLVGLLERRLERVTTVHLIRTKVRNLIGLHADRLEKLFYLLDPLLGREGVNTRFCARVRSFSSMARFSRLIDSVELSDDQRIFAKTQVLKMLLQVNEQNADGWFLDPHTGRMFMPTVVLDSTTQILDKGENQWGLEHLGELSDECVGLLLDELDLGSGT